MLYSSRHISELFSISHETVRTWSSEFARHLSPHANPGENRHRQFTEDDLAVFALVSEMKAQRLKFEDIHATLDTGQRGESPIRNGLPVLAIEHQTHVERLQNQIMVIRQEHENTLAQLRELELGKAQIEGALERSDNELSNARKQIDALNREIGKLESQLEIERQKSSPD